VRSPNRRSQARRTWSKLSGRLQELREELVDRIWLSLIPVAIIGAPLSATRVQATGWLPLYGYYIGLGALVIGVALARRRLRYPTKVALLIATFWGVGLPGLLTLGLLGAGLWWLVMSGLLIGILRSERTGITTLLATLVVVAAVGALFVSGILVVPGDANVYARTASSWLTLLVATTLMPLVVLFAVGKFQRTLLQLADELEGQRDEIAQLAARDELTGLPTSGLFADRLEMALHAGHRQGHRVALLYVDLDGFKQVNDEHGHDAGDVLLRAIAHRLSMAIREDDTVARVGGDEFVVILAAVTEIETAETVAERLLAELRRPVAYEDRILHVGASIGLAVYPDHASGPYALRRVADRAMYRVKRTGAGGWALGEPASAEWETSGLLASGAAADADPGTAESR